MSDEEKQKQSDQPSENKQTEPDGWKKFASAAGKEALSIARVAGKAAADGLVVIGKAIDGQIEAAAILGQKEGFWEAQAPVTQVFEAVVKELNSAHIRDRQHYWRKIQPLPDYLQIVLDASWEWDHTGPMGNKATTPVSVHGLLKFEEVDSLTRIYFNYDYESSGLKIDALSLKVNGLIKATNMKLKEICESFSAT